MKILHIANFGFNKQGAHFYCTDRKISAGLIENGHFVYDFSFRDMARMGTIFKTKKLGAGWANKEILKIVNNLEPDLVLVGHSDLMSPNVLKEIKQRYPKTKIAFWYVDWLRDKKKSRFIFDFLPYVDAIFATTAGDLLKQFEGYGATLSYIPNMIDPAIEKLKQFEKKEFKHEMVFFGTINEKGTERGDFLITLKERLGDEISFFGTSEHPAVYGQKYIDELSTAKMGVNFSRKNDMRLYSSDRIVQLTGNGLLTFCPQIPGFEKLYSQDEIVYFSSVDDFIDKYYFYKANDAQAKAIAEKGWIKTHTRYNNKRITKFMLETIFNQTYSESYEWAEEVY